MYQKFKRFAKYMYVRWNDGSDITVGFKTMIPDNLIFKNVLITREREIAPPKQNLYNNNA